MMNSVSFKRSAPVSKLKRHQFARNVGSIAEFLARPVSKEAADDLVEEVDFPNFVADLIEGVFQAIVDSSITEMDAYGKLVANVTKAVEEFANDNAAADQAFEWLKTKYSDLLEPCGPDDDRNRHKKRETLPRRIRRRSMKEKHYLVAKIMRTGLKKIVGAAC